MTSQAQAFELTDFQRQNEEDNKNFADNVLPAAKQHDWTTVKQNLKLHAKCIKDYGIQDESGFTVLHYACASVSEDDRQSQVNALKAVKEIFKFMKEWTYSPNELIDVVNKKDCEERTPLCIAVEKNYDNVVEFLLHNSADVTLPVQKKINDRFHKILIKLFDNGIELNRSLTEYTNEHWWTIKYDFSAVSGLPSKFDCKKDFDMETKFLATILTLPSRKRHNILMHPLVQLFVHAKGKQYLKYIWISIFYHMIWYLVSAIFMIRTLNNTVYAVPASNTVETAMNQRLILTNGTYYTMKLEHPIWLRFANGTGENFVDENDFKIYINEPIWFRLENDTNTTNQVFEHKLKSKDSIQAHLVPNAQFLSQKVNKVEIHFPVEFTLANESISREQTNNKIESLQSKLFVYGLFPIFLLISFLKEMFECCQSPSQRYYWCQYENLGQWAVLGVNFMAIIVPLLGEMPFWIQTVVSTIYSVGVVSSSLLIQSQFTKTERFGVYNLMMIKSFKKLLKFIIAFSPMLLAYVVVLNKLLPEETGLAYSWGIGFGGILAMLTGELNYAAVFSEDKVKQIPNVLPAVIVFILFILTVVILLQNLLIGLTVSNIERLKEKAIAAHIATRLEVVNLLEAFVFFMKHVRRTAFANRQYSGIEQNEDLTDFQQPSQETHCTEEDFLNLPKRIQAVIKEKQEIYLARVSTIANCGET